MKRTCLYVDGAVIRNPQGQPVHLRGTNFGGWLMMEAYFMYSPHSPEQGMKKDFAKALGEKALADLEQSFRDHFIQEQDMRQLAQWGFNCVRVPFNYRLINLRNGRIDPKGGIQYLDAVITWAKKYKVYVMLDLHGAPGSQNHDWHSDSYGKAELWTKKSNRRLTYALWEMIADRYKDETWVAGYDLLNEAVLDNNDLLNEFYRETIKAIRRVDKNHILFIEGTRWAQVIDILDDFADDNWAYSIHFYEPLEYTFNYIPQLRYPLKSKQGVWDKNTLYRRLEGFAQFVKAKKRPIHVGEFGVNYRNGVDQEDVYLKDVVTCFNDFGFHWNYWTYKAVKNHMFPDGIYSYYANPAWVGRGFAVTGWNRWKDVWLEQKHAMIKSWETSEFTLNHKVHAILVKK